jgi:hypothetical protein
MRKEIISPRTRQLFREHFVGTTLGTITDKFGAAGISPLLEYDPPFNGQRRILVEQHYCTLDFTNWEDIQKLLDVFGSVLADAEDEIERYAPGPSQQAVRDSFDKLTRALRHDGFEYRDGKVVARGHAPDVARVAAHLDLPELHRQIDRMRTAVDGDPRLAIGTAKELVETTCKTILRDRSVDIDPAWDIPRLVKEARKTLRLLPEDVPDAAKGAETIKRVLNSLASVTTGLAELRGLYGTGHGPDGRVKGLSPRHARLAVGAASTLAAFLLETHEERE